MCGPTIFRARINIADIKQREEIMELTEIDYAIQSCTNSIICHIREQNLENLKKMPNCKVEILATIA